MSLFQVGSGVAQVDEYFWALATREAWFCWGEEALISSICRIYDIEGKADPHKTIYDEHWDKGRK